MTVLLHVSDTHFGTERTDVVASLERLAREQRPDVLLLSGDITQRATAKQFKKARAFVDRLNVPATLAVPGNHDIPLFNLIARMLSPYANYVESFGSNLEPEFENDDVLVLALNTTSRFRHVDGELLRTQVERIARRLRLAKPAQWRIVLVHHPIAVSREQDRHNLLRGHAHAIPEWARAGVDFVAGGHIHLPFVLPLHERVSHLPRSMWAIQAGTAVSTRVREGIGNSVNLIRLGPTTALPDSLHRPRGRCVIERWDYVAVARRFELVQTHRPESEHSTAPQTP